MENLGATSTPTRSISQREPPRPSPSTKKKPTIGDGGMAGGAVASPTPANPNPYGSFAPPPPPGTANAAAGQQSPLTRERAERPAPPPPGAAAQSLQKAAAAASQGVATPRRREKKDKASEVDIVKRLREICTDADPTRLYRNLVKIGQG
jgi:p21-activated kinase 1